MLYRICLCHLCNEHDADDALQNVFIQYLKKAPVFNEPEHEKAWLIRVTLSICRNMYKFRLKHTHINIDDLYDYYKSENDSSILDSVMRLPQKYKIVVDLFYVEGYQCDEIEKIIGISSAAVRKRLQKARELLKLDYEGSYTD